jgi:antitoxin CptB
VTSKSQARRKKLAMRSHRRGIKEMDLILGGFIDAHGAMLSDADMDVYEVMLEENDHDLYRWVVGAQAAPTRFASLIASITENYNPTKR